MKTPRPSKQDQILSARQVAALKRCSPAAVMAASRRDPPDFPSVMGVDSDGQPILRVRLGDVRKWRPPGPGRRPYAK